MRVADCVLIGCRSASIGSMLKRRCLDLSMGSVDVEVVKSNGELNRALNKQTGALVLIENTFYGTATLRILMRLKSRFRRMVFSVFSLGEYSEKSAARFIAWGALSFIDMRLSAEMIRDALKKTLRGEYAAPVKVEQLAEEIELPPCGDIELSEREIDIALLAAQDLDEAEIATRLGIKYGTVRVYLSHIYKKLNVNGVVGLTRCLFGMGLLWHDDNLTLKYGAEIQELIKSFSVSA